MNIDRIQDLLSGNRSAIMAASSFSERLDVIYDLLDKEYPQTTVMAALHGPITNLGDFLSRAELEPLMYAVKKSSETGTEFLVTDEEINEILQTIYKTIK